MNLMFWKKKTIIEDDAGNSADDALEQPDGHAAPHRSPGHETHDQEASGDDDGEATGAGAAHSKRRLIIGAAIGVLLLTVIGLITWKIFQPSHKPINIKQPVIKADTTPEIQPEPLTGKPLIKLPPVGHLVHSQPNEIQTKDRRANADALGAGPAKVENPSGVSSPTEGETLKKNNSEPQAQSEILKKQQPTSAVPANQTVEKAQLTYGRGGIAVGNKNSKATAMSLKEAIEAMNASSGEPAKKPAK